MPQDYAAATETIVMTILETVAVTAAATDSVSGVRIASFSDVADATDSIEGSRKVILIFDTAAAHDTARTTQQSTAEVFDRARAFDTVTPRSQFNISDTAAAVDTPVSKHHLIVIDHAAAADSQTRNVANLTAVASHAAAHETVTGSNPRGAIADSADASESVTLIQQGLESPVDTADATDTVGASKRTSASVAATARAHETVTTFLHAVQVIKDVAEAEDFVSMPGSTLAALWTNTLSAAPVTWSKLPFNSMIEIDGRVYGASSDGIGELVPAGGAVEAIVMWDLKDFKDLSRKQLDCAYVAGTSDDPLVMIVTPGRYSYRYVARDAAPTKAQNMRVKFGKGLKDRYYRFTLKNSNGSDFNVGNVDVMIADSSRKIGGRNA